MSETMCWHELRPDAGDPQEALLAQWVASEDRHVDPYWLLADRMGYAGLDRRAGPLLPVMIEHDKPVSIDAKRVAPARFELAWRRPHDLFCLIAKGSSEIRRFQIDAPRAQGPEARTEGGTLETQAFDAIEPPVRLVAVIDNGLPFAHPDLLTRNVNAIAPRFHSVWDQRDGAPVPTNWVTDLNLAPFGALLTQAAMQTLVGPTYTGLDEARAYAQASYPVSDGRTPHGCGVTHLLASSKVGLKDGSRHDFGAWSATPIIGIQLPRPNLQDTAGGWLGFYALAALRYAVDRAGDIAAQARWHLVANLSYGSLAGPHDGTSMFERAVDELVAWVREPKRDSKLDVVMASGNSRHLPIHAVSVLPVGGSAHMRCVVPPDNPQECQFELWLPAKDEIDAPLDPTHISVTVTPPGGVPQTVSCGSAYLLFEASASTPCAGVVFAHKVAQGLNGTMVLLVVRPTVCNGQDDRARAGRWTLDVHSAHAAAVTVHLRAERNDLVGRTRRAQQARLEADPQGTSQITADGTLSHCAHGVEVVVAGAVQQDNSIVSFYTGRGWANARMRPDWYAPADANAALRGVLVPGILAGQISRMAGTSIAAPWVARWLSSGADPTELQPTYEDAHQLGPPMLRTVRYV
jgi:hypothetical protein